MPDTRKAGEPRVLSSFRPKVRRRGADDIGTATSRQACG